MLYWLAKQLTPHFSGFNVFSYLTVRAIFAVITALALGLLLGPWMIEKLKFGQIGQVVRDDGPKIAFLQGRHSDHGRHADPRRDLRRARCCGPISPTASCGWCSP